MVKSTHVSFEYLSDKRANFIFAGLAIPDVPGIHTERVRYLPSSCKIVVLGLVRREFRRSGVSARVGSSDVSHFNCLRGFTVLVIPDVSGIHTGRIRYGRPEANG